MQFTNILFEFKHFFGFEMNVLNHQHKAGQKELN